ncbi:MAG: hypothetical protein MUC87_00525 [Bacteroidia bacterium]|nr:hypothetical protein [Bacteroidia bacterium]
MTTLSEDEKKDLINELNSFASWLNENNITQEKIVITQNIELPYANEDWMMMVKPEDNTVSFNTLFRNRCSALFYKQVVLHEFFHLAVQKVPNKEDAVKLKDDFGDQLMKLIDIEADFFTALYMKERLNVDLVDYLELMYEGGQIFADSWIRIGKFERFLGSLLSITKLYIKSINDPSETPSHDLYLPCISPIYTESSLHILVIRKEHIYFDQISAGYDDFVNLKRCYTNTEEITKKGYIKLLITIASKALGMKVPKDISTKVNNIKP